MNTAPTDLPTDRLRQMRDGHDPDTAAVGRARAERVARLQRQIIEADEIADGLRRYREAARHLDVDPQVGRLVEREIRRMGRATVAHRNRLDVELRALQ